MSLSGICRKPERVISLQRECRFEYLIQSYPSFLDVNSFLEDRGYRVHFLNERKTDDSRYTHVRLNKKLDKKIVKKLESLRCIPYRKA